MPIEGLSDIVRLPRLGKIHLGVKEVHPKTHNPYPRATDYFVCPKEVQEVFGEKPDKLRIMLPVEEEEVFAPQYYKCYSMTRGLICRGDGKTCSRLVDLDTGALATRDSKRTEWREMTCPGEGCPENQTRQCRRVMCLQFLLPEVPGLGVWQIDTSSFYSIVNINSGIKLVRGSCGRVRMIPLVLSLGPQEVSPEGVKKVVRVLNLTSKARLADILRAAALPTLKVLMPAPAADTEPPGDLFPEEALEEAEPAAMPPEPLAPTSEPAPAPAEELFPQQAPSDGDREKRLLWQEIKGLRASSGASNSQVRLWFKKYYDLEVSPAEADGELPPQKVTLAMLKRLHFNLRQYQPRLDEQSHTGGKP